MLASKEHTSVSSLNSPSSTQNTSPKNWCNTAKPTSQSSTPQSFSERAKSLCSGNKPCTYILTTTNSTKPSTSWCSTRRLPLTMRHTCSWLSRFPIMTCIIRALTFIWRSSPCWSMSCWRPWPIRLIWWSVPMCWGGWILFSWLSRSWRLCSRPTPKRSTRHWMKCTSRQRIMKS